jgi:hypothetical protein
LGIDSLRQYFGIFGNWIGRVVVVDRSRRVEGRRIEHRGDGDVLVNERMNDNNNMIYNLHNL